MSGNLDILAVVALEGVDIACLYSLVASPVGFQHQLAVVRNRLAVAHLYLLVGEDKSFAVCLHEFAAIAHSNQFVVALDKDVGLPDACVPPNPPLDPPSLCYSLNN